jgi:hypothetical protein
MPRGICVAVLFGMLAVSTSWADPEGAPLSPAPGEWMKAITYPDVGNWEWLLNTSDYSSVWLISRRSATRRSNVASIWVRIENRDGRQDQYSGKYYVSAAYREDLDCENPATRVESVTLYAGRNLSGDAVYSDSMQGRQAAWLPAVPGSINDALVGWVCDHVKEHATTKEKTG